MNQKISDNVWKILVCPYCGNALRKMDGGAMCDNCQSLYEYTDTGALDLRLRQSKKLQYECYLGTNLHSESGLNFKVLLENSNPEVDFRNFDAPYHLSREIMSHFPRAKNSDSLMLDLGCGNTVHSEVCEHAEYEYVGLDYNSKRAPILGDAHALPFKDKSFEFILSIAVLEHIRFPFVMMKEAHRVLKPNSKFIGTVGFLEPFHDNSFYHHTHLGTCNSLQEGGFEIEHVAPNDKWPVLIAQARMGLFPKMPNLLSKALIMPLQALHKLWWKVGCSLNKKAPENMRLVNTTGAFSFVARRKID